MRLFGFAGWSGSGKTTLIERIVPLLVATDALQLPVLKLTQDSDGVVRPLAANRASFRDVIDLVLSRFAAQPIPCGRGRSPKA